MSPALRNPVGLVLCLGAVSVSAAYTVYTGWPFNTAEAQRRQQETSADLQMPVEMAVDLGGGVMLPLMLVPAGGTRIGTPTTEPGFEWDEQLRGITVPKPFYMSKFQLTRGQFRAVMGRYPAYSSHEDTTGGGDSLPARISYAEIEGAVVVALNARLPPGFTSRIPPKELWEHACRAGTQTTWYSGIDTAALARIGWYQGNSGDVIHPVGQKEPNPWGLHDMVGNVWTWAFTSGGATATDCYVKGGSFSSEAFGNGCRTGNLMIQSVPSGFRVMVDLPDAALGVRERAGRELRVSQAPMENGIHTVSRAGPVLLQGSGGAFLLTGRILAAPGNSAMWLPAR